MNIKDVARKAGVAVSTVSRVINNHPDVSKETKEHVLEVIKELNYIPNNSARNLKRTSSKNIGVFVLGEYNHFFADIVEVIESEVSAQGYSVVVHYHHSIKMAIESAAQFVLEKKLAGLIYLGGFISKESEGYIKNLEVPVVFASTIIEDDIDNALFSSVSIDEEKAVNQVVTYLLELGHKNIGLITEHSGEKGVARERFEVFKRSLAAKGIDFSDNYIESGDFSIKSGFQCMTNLIKRCPDITAIFAVNDLMAIGAIKAIYASGSTVPEAISVIGFDGLEYGKYYNPSLTTVKQSGFEFGKISSELISRAVKEGKASEHIIIDTEFVKRDSCRSLN